MEDSAISLADKLSVKSAPRNDSNIHIGQTPNQDELISIRDHQNQETLQPTETAPTSSFRETENRHSLSALSRAAYGKRDDEPSNIYLQTPEAVWRQPMYNTIAMTATDSTPLRPKVSTDVGDTIIPIQSLEETTQDAQFSPAAEATQPDEENQIADTNHSGIHEPDSQARGSSSGAEQQPIDGTHSSLSHGSSLLPMAPVPSRGMSRDVSANPSGSQTSSESDRKGISYHFRRAAAICLLILRRMFVVESCMNAVSVSYFLISTISVIVVLATNWDRECASPLKGWLLVFLIFTVSYVILKHASTNSGNNADREYDESRFKYVALVLFRFVAWALLFWFFFGLWWITEGGECSSTNPAVFYLSLVLVVANLVLILLSFCIACCICTLNSRRRQHTASGPTRTHDAPRALAKEEIMNVREVVYEEGMYGEDNNLCSICLCEFEPEEKLRVLPCRHVFHSSCVDRWLEIDGSCAVCRQSVVVSNPDDGTRHESREGANHANGTEPRDPVSDDESQGDEVSNYEDSIRFHPRATIEHHSRSEQRGRGTQNLPGLAHSDSF